MWGHHSTSLHRHPPTRASPHLLLQHFPHTRAWGYHTSLPPRHNPATGLAEKPYLCRWVVSRGCAWLCYELHLVC